MAEPGADPLTPHQSLESFLDDFLAPRRPPQRVQRKRGVKLPPGARYVGRPSRWGNPYRIGEVTEVLLRPDGTTEAIDWRTRESAISEYRTWLDDESWDDPAFLAPLRGLDLACWCPLDVPCHADVLLESLR